MHSWVTFMRGTKISDGVIAPAKMTVNTVIQHNIYSCMNQIYRYLIKILIVDHLLAISTVERLYDSLLLSSGQMAGGASTSAVPSAWKALSDKMI